MPIAGYSTRSAYSWAGGASGNAELYLGVSTVKIYVNRLLTKLELRDRTQAAVFDYEHGIVAPGHAGGE